jgi:hypothetical protein
MADEPHAKPDPNTVTVHAARDSEKLNAEISGFVSNIKRKVGVDSVARWNVPICPLVGGLSRDKAEYFLQRISDVAREVDAPLAPEKCTPNLLVVVTGAPRELLERWRKKSPGFFDMSNGPGAIGKFMNSDLPVRAWYDAGESCAGGLATFGLSGDMLNVGCSSGIASRLSRNSIRIVTSVIVVIDSAQIKGFKVGQIADYTAMVGLAELVEPRAALALPSVFNMFFPGDPKPPGLSDWDRWFLRALYHSDARSVTQISRIRAEMFRDAVSADSGK